MGGEYGSVIDFIACCLLAILLVLSSKLARLSLVVLAACAILLGFYAIPAFFWEAVGTAASLTVHSTFSTSYPAVFRDAAVFLYVLVRIWGRDGGFAAVLQHTKNARDAIIAVVVSFALVFGYHLIAAVPKCRAEAQTNISIPPDGLHAGVPLFALQKVPTKEPQKPQLEMYFVNPANVEWRIKNRAGLVQNVWYWFVLIDIDQPLLARNPPGYPGPFRMLSQKIDFINAYDIAGAAVLPLDFQQAVRAGDRIFGTAEFICPGCKGKGYWLYFKHGSDGWFSEMHAHTSRGLALPLGAVVTDPDKEIEKLVPPSTRVAIKNERRQLPVSD